MMTAPRKPRVRELDHVVPRATSKHRLPYRRAGLPWPTNEAISLWQLKCGTGMIDLQPLQGDSPLPEYGKRHMDHFCIGVDGRNLDEIVAYLKSKGVAMIGEPMPRRGARGVGFSIYAVDPDGNIVEIKQDPDEP
jgi:catechol 2,3-dioxygenase-like lactoylglutathione lyase family enzyme